MNIFVTVGTTRFDGLLLALDALKCAGWEITAQTANPNIQLRNLKHFPYTNDIESYVDEADLIICHGGAGTVYSLLEKNKRLLVIPNLERQDKHQLDLTEYVATKGYALQCRNLQDVENEIRKSEFFVPNPYKNIGFFCGKEISNILLASIE